MKNSELGDALTRATLDVVSAPNEFDAIIVGAGAAGGLAAKLLTEAGRRVLVLDAGLRPSFWQAPYRRTTSNIVQTLADPVWMERLPMKLINLGRRGLKLAGRVRQPVQAKCFAWEMSPEALIDDRENPYTAPKDAQFLWFRSRQLGGKMIVPGHGRQYFRMAAPDLAPKDDLSPAWPIDNGELSAWYDQVENHLGLSGNYDECEWVPNSRLANDVTKLPAETDLQAQIKDQWPKAQPLLGRYAAPSDSLVKAAQTGRMMCRQGAAAHRVEVDANGAANGVTWYDRRARANKTARAPLVFLCASALESTRILMLSKSARHPGGIGADSGALGRNLMDHVIVGCSGLGGGLADEPVDRSPGRCVYVPRFDLRHDNAQVDGRGYGIQLYQASIGKGRSGFTAVSFGEMTPRANNRITLDPSRTDACGIPILNIECRHSEVELAQASDQSQALKEIADLLDVNLYHHDTKPAPPGTAIHECGTARMGTSPDMSVLDPNNQCWDAPGVYVTDGASFPSQGALNPTLTIKALTARACAHVTANNDSS